MRNIFRFFLSLVTAIVLFGCSDRLDDYYTAEDLAGLKVHIQLPDYSRALVKTRALDTDEKINSVTVIAYKSDGGFISQQPVTMGTDGKISPSLPSGTSTVAVVTNVSLTDDQCANLSSTFLTTTPDAKAPVCWGSATVNDLLKSTDPTISLLRMTAKVTVQVASGVTNFSLEGLEMCNTASNGTIVPADGKGDAVTTPTVDSNKPTYTITTGNTTSPDPLVFYETPAGNAYLIVKGKYEGSEGFYKVKMFKDPSKNNDEYDLLRNHNYIVTINSVNEAGYGSIEAAKAGEAENRMTVDIKDDNPPIVDMISCKDYELGVCAPLTTDGKAGTINASVVSSYQNSSNVYDYTITGAPDWVTVGTATKTDLPTATGKEGEKSSNGVLCVIPITVKQNPTENERTATLTVTAGDLTRTITITQAGYDFLAADNRKVQFLINGSLVSIDGTKQSDDYFGAFLPAVKGVKAVDNQGLVRDHGLHFAAVKGNTYSYKIPKLTGDSYTNSDSRIKVTPEDNDYLVELANNDDESLWVSNSFSITNASGTKITYPVYHTGVFHHITSTDNLLGTAKKTGWFYYGIVKVKGKSGSIYHLLDRNIGATNNGFYSPSTQETMGNEGAKGAYVILTKKAITTTESSSWYVYNAPKGVSSISFILKSVSGADNSKKLTGDVSSVSSDVYYKVNGSSASLTSDRPNFKDDGSTISVYVKASSAPYIYVWYTDANRKKQEPNGDFANTKAMSELSVNTALVGNEFMPSTYFQVPTESYLDEILPKVETRHTKAGEAYLCYVIKTTGGSTVQPAEVYIPVTGYYEGTSYRNENHANIWTCTRLSGYQGFSSSSPEFGFWFRYLDCHNSIEEITNMRIVNGSAGRYGTIYNAMPVRGIHKE